MMSRFVMRGWGWLGVLLLVAAPTCVDPDPPIPFEWIGVLGSGQSLSVGAEGLPTSRVASSYGNLMLSDPRAVPDWDGLSGDGDELSVVPLFEPVRPYRYVPFGQYPDNVAGETGHLTLADQASRIELDATGRSLVTAHSVVGVSGMPLVAIAEGGTTNAYAAGLYEARVLAARAAAAGKSFGYGAIVFTHGEADSASATYGQRLYAHWEGLNADLQAITGQTRDIPLLITQQSSLPWPADGTQPQRSASTQAQWWTSVNHPGEIVLVGPKYQYAPSLNLIHLSAAGYRALAIKNAQVFHEVVVNGEPWRPLEPTSITSDGNVITVSFHVPSPPLAWDETIPAPHGAGTLHPAWQNGRGFEVADSTGDLTIASVAIVGDDVQITLAAPPTGTGLVVRYAMTPERYGWASGPSIGRRGQLRDSDPFEGIDRRTVNVNVTAESPIVTSAGGATFEAMGARELVTGASFAPGTIILAVAAPVSVTLSSPWTGPTGDRALTVGDRANIAVTVTNGSTTVTARGWNHFGQVETGAPVTGTDVQAGLTVAALPPIAALWLSTPWTGASGTAALTFRSDQRNYCVQFEWPL
jgi:hypothetical protein